MPGQQDGVERGLLGVFICASLAVQFESIQYDWMNLGLQDPRITGTNDPVTGANDPAFSCFRLPTSSGTIELRGFSRFVRTRGGAYCFLPTLSGLRHLGRRRAMAGPVGCGLCGIQSLAEAAREVPPVRSALRIWPGAVEAAMVALAGAQAMNRDARAVHAGRLAEADFQRDWGLRPPVFDPMPGFADAVKRDRIAAWFAALPPPFEPITGGADVGSAVVVNTLVPTLNIDAVASVIAWPLRDTPSM